VLEAAAWKTWRWPRVFW